MMLRSGVPAIDARAGWLRASSQAADDVGISGGPMEIQWNH